MTEFSQIIEAVRQHGDFVYALIFAYAGSHSLIVALFAGYAAQHGVIDLNTTIASCFAGSCLGDIVRFWLARRYGERLLIKMPSVAKRAATIRRLIDRHSLWLPLIHRYPYGVRGLAAFAYGLSAMTSGTFLLLNVTGATLWAVSMVTAGYAFGTVSDKVLGQAVSGLSVFALVLFLAVSWLLSRRLEQAIEADARRDGA